MALQTLVACGIQLVLQQQPTVQPILLKQLIQQDALELRLHKIVL